MSNSTGTRPLYRLARLHGVQTAYYDVAHRRRQVSVETLTAVLKALGASIESLRDVPSALREWHQTWCQRLLEPVVVTWDGDLSTTEVRLPSSVADSRFVGYLTLETGSRQRLEWHGADLPVVQAAEVEGTRYAVKKLPLPGGLPWGYHHLSLEIAGEHAETLIITSPRKAYVPPDESGRQTWGVFLPLYALYTHRSWGSGDFPDLETLIAWVTEMGGGVVATLPLLPTFLDEPFEPSPYTPVSRLLWNEFYLDVTRVAELQSCPTAESLMVSSSFQRELGALRDLPLVDYRRQMALKRRCLEELSRSCFAEAANRLQALQRFAEANPVVDDYACFRAACEKQHTSWPSWPQPLREGVLTAGDYDEEARRYHLYVQWLAHQQLKDLSERTRERGPGLYLDLPLGVHPDGYDVWRNQDLFVQDISVGAPPDAFFTRGQDWGFPPLHPEKLRQQSYSYYIAYLRHHLKHAGILRIDHIMGLHRLFWIPHGKEASQGLYVRRHVEEFYAILTLESHRHKTIIVGEDLGTVPPQVRPAMTRHGLQRMYVVQYELTPNQQKALRAVPTDVVASLNTHDMPPFAAFCQGLDIEDRLKQGLLGEVEAQIERKTRQALRQALVSFIRHKGWLAEEDSLDQQAVLGAILAFLGASSASVVLVNLEDLWLETRPQNVPGTREVYPNWRRKASYSFEMFSRSPQVVDVLGEIDRMRKRGKNTH